MGFLVTTLYRKLGPEVSKGSGTIILRKKTMRRATFRVIRFPLASGDRYVAMAWNYAEAVLISPGDHASYTEARIALNTMAQAADVQLRWFDGHYVSQPDGSLVPDPLHERFWRNHCYILEKEG